jgi:mono/diheme cytochrome c family protein
MHYPARVGLLVAALALLGAGQALAQEKAAAPAGVTPAAIAQGDSIFHKDGMCYACHGSKARSVPTSPTPSGCTATAPTT